MVRGLQFAYVFLIYVLALGVAAQAFFAGMTIFASANWQQAHDGLGWLLALVAIALPILVFAARLPRGIAVLTLIVFGLMFLQVSLVTWLAALQMAELTALHPANALLLFYTVLLTAHRASRWVFSRGPRPLAVA